MKAIFYLSCLNLLFIAAIDVWMATCMVFVFSALIEFAYVNVLARVEKRRKETLRKQSIMCRSTSEEHNGSETTVRIRFFYLMHDTYHIENEHQFSVGAKSIQTI